MTRNLKKLLWRNKDTFFKNTFEQHEVCRYSFADFFYSDVKNLAEKHGVSIVYAKHFKQYKNFGDNCFIIVKAPEMKNKTDIVEDVAPVFFDPKTLMI